MNKGAGGEIKQRDPNAGRPLNGRGRRRRILIRKEGGELLKKG